ncbi:MULTISPECIES: SRPBCC family protein [unclassified Janthinobacterium]|uniref:SRPBCC family protein n=1 Tax=unclassified Janthinobacterium TaxID=2610881 RepID=UPI0018CA0021|nr:SRPBCC family protein [Janthinobacterium sp. CG_23.4]MDH6157859.1 uncharacterized protein YndB with AHSA1/START domain [Janthinobacterium sp. CG_23.4]
MIKKTLLLIVVVVAAILGYATTKPDTFSVEREIVIKAPPDKIAALITDFHYWAAWSPWEKLDPAMRRTFMGTASGLGAQYAWQGNDKVGAGRMEITEAAQPTRTVIKLDFQKPFESHNTTTFSMATEGDGTRVNWTMTGPSPYVSKVMMVFVSMDTMIGKDFEKGLNNLKAAAER